MKKLFTFCFFILSASIFSNESYVYIIEPKDGSQVVNPVKVVFGLSGMGVAPAGVDKPGTGHHHLLIDLKQLPDLTKPIPTDKNHLHFFLGLCLHSCIFLDNGRRFSRHTDPQSKSEIIGTLISTRKFIIKDFFKKKFNQYSMALAVMFDSFQSPIYVVEKNVDFY